MVRSNYIVHDCETGGLDPLKNPMTQYACVILDYATLKEIDRWETFIRPYNNLVIEKAALEGTMVTMTDVKNGISLKDFVKTLSIFLENHRANTKSREMGRLVSVGQNIPFDHGFLDYAFKAEGKDLWEYIHPNFVDTFVMAKMCWGLDGTEKLNLTSNCNRVKINLTDAHGAMNDVIATADLFRWFTKKLRRKQSEGGTSDTERAKGSEFFEFKCGK